jgi:PadR family transcriptional regulator PadR
MAPTNDPVDAHRAKMISLVFIWRLSKKPMHGYSLARELRNAGPVVCKPATVYALLADLEKRGLITGKMDSADSHPRKVFHSTAKGRKFYETAKREKVKGLMREFYADLLR